MEKVVAFIFFWVGCMVAYFWLIKWIQGRFNLNMSGSQNWGAVHIFIMLFFAIPATALLGTIYLITYFVDKKKGAPGDDIEI